MNDLIDRLRSAWVSPADGEEAADVIERLRGALKRVRLEAKCKSDAAVRGAVLTIVSNALEGSDEPSDWQKNQQAYEADFGDSDE